MTTILVISRRSVIFSPEIHLLNMDFFFELAARRVRLMDFTSDRQLNWIYNYELEFQMTPPFLNISLAQTSQEPEIVPGASVTGTFAQFD